MCRRVRFWAFPTAFLGLVLAGCESPYHADRGALLGGLGGAGVGALVGNAVGNTGAGAAIGAGVGALTGGLVGAEMDEMEARNRAMIEQRLGRQVAPGAVRIDEVVAMVRSGVNEELIVTHVRSHGMAAPLQSNDLIMLQQQGVPVSVIKAMQESPPQVVQAIATQPVYVTPAPPPVVVAPYPYDPWWRPHYRCWGPPPPRGHVSWGVSIH